MAAAHQRIRASIWLGEEMGRSVSHLVRVHTFTIYIYKSNPTPRSILSIVRLAASEGTDIATLCCLVVMTLCYAVLTAGHILPLGQGGGHHEIKRADKYEGMGCS